MIRTALIDYDGTIHDTDAVLVKSLDGILGLSGKELYNIYVFDVHRTLVHTTYLEKHDDMMFHCRLIFRHLSKPFNKKVAEQICLKFEDASEVAKTNPIYFPDALPALKKIKESGIRLYLSTGRDAEVKKNTFEMFTGATYFTGTFSESLIGSFKTEPEYYMAALSMTESKPNESVSIGDTPLSDIRPAKLMGMKTIWVNRRKEPTPKNEDQKADHMVSNLLYAAELIS